MPGPAIFVEFVDGTISKLQASGPYSFIGPVNHSIRSPVVLWARRAAERDVLWPMQYVITIQVVLIACVLVCLGVILATAYRVNRKDVDVSLLGSALCAVLIPGVSHDYSLPVLAGPFALLLLKSEQVIDRADARHRHLLAPILMCSAAYTCLLFSPDYRPPFLGHNMPILMAMVIGVTWLSLAAKNLLGHAWWLIALLWRASPARP